MHYGFLALPGQGVYAAVTKLATAALPRRKLIMLVCTRDIIIGLLTLFVISTGISAVQPQTTAAQPQIADAKPQATGTQPQTTATQPQTTYVSSSVMTAQRSTDPARAPYGSGQLGAWQAKTNTISSPAQFKNTVARNGVLIVGDSIANQADYMYASRVFAAHGLPTAVNQWPGRPTKPAVDWLVAHADLIPARGVVMATGANDIFNPAGWWHQVKRVMAAADGKPVYWITVHVDRWSGTADRRVADMRNSAWINDQLYSMARSYRNLIVVDWHAKLSQGYNESLVATWLSDGVHLTPLGINGWCDLLALRMRL